MSLIDSSVSENYTEWVCSGTIINHWYIATAAHCTEPRFTGGFPITRVRLGVHNVQDDIYGDKTDQYTQVITYLVFL